jgi:hypothetical protein
MNNPSFPDDASTWNKRFAGEGYVFGTEPNAYLREHAAQWRAGSRLLCVADGEGRNSVWLAAQGMLVDAFDISEVGVAKARKLAAATGVSVELSVSDCDSCPWPVPSLLSHLYTEEMLRTAFASTEILEFRAYDADLTEGTRHRGQSALIGMVARRT